MGASQRQEQMTKLIVFGVLALVAACGGVSLANEPQPVSANPSLSVITPAPDFALRDTAAKRSDSPITVDGRCCLRSSSPRARAFAR